MSQHDYPRLFKPLIGLAIVLALGFAGFALLRLESLTRQSGSHQLDLSQQLAIDPALIRFRQTEQLPVTLQTVHALAIGPQDRIYVGGDRSVEILRPDGQRETAVPCAGEPRCLAVGSEDHVAPGRLYVSTGAQIEVFDPEGNPLATWDDFGEKSLFTSVVAVEQDVLVADAGNRVVLRLDPNGKQLGRIQGQRGFVVPSPYFDLVAAADGLVYVVNPGARRIEVYTLDGAPQLVWGNAGSDIGAFFGCCNPSHLARLPDGRFVTSEKGIPRIKVYSPQGQFESVVAGPEQLAIRLTAIGDPRATEAAGGYDIAADSQGRILVLDPIIHCVRVYESEPAVQDKET